MCTEQINMARDRYQAPKHDVIERAVGQSPTPTDIPPTLEVTPRDAIWPSKGALARAAKGVKVIVRSHIRGGRVVRSHTRG